VGTFFANNMSKYLHNVPGDTFKIKQSLFRKLLTFLKLFFLHIMYQIINLKSLYKVIILLFTIVIIILSFLLFRMTTNRFY